MSSADDRLDKRLRRGRVRGDGVAGGGRATKDSTIDYGVGIVLHKKVDEPVAAGESLATIHAADEAAARKAVAELTACYTITPDAPPAAPFIKAIIR